MGSFNNIKMGADSVLITVSGLVGTEQSLRSAQVCVLVVYDRNNDVYVPLASDELGNLFTSGVN